MFRSSIIIRKLVLSLAKVTLKHSVKLCPIGYLVVWQHVLEWCVCVLCAVQNGTELFGGAAACLGVVCVLCAVQNETELGGVFFCTVCSNITLARLSTSSLMMVEDRNM
jgi:hypothetical protein